MRIFIVSGLALCLSGCASIVSEGTQNLTVDTDPSGADCKLVNQEGTFYVRNTPGTVPIDTTCKPMTVECTKNGYRRVQETIDYSHKGAAWGNIILGGGIGYIVDRQTGAACDYPQSITVTLEKDS